ncbi:MAG: thymidylate synthase, flavin-dependent [Candidatus Lambdaproteobacteria bacterium RIFOXYD1_FULL_56_27]|uniref:FAD-dependent thymidylate synthase n=1 Tax=Candidatus Lambdaproteobacteria bacterium RIFOXYD2_FULL_56_26 TaxID=1817773 RepID=A0A1F6GSJ2_9PROT|nr:MAG: thymidylate synthase, flavin-dependent [Candidatus Lambdaproteobacteria bacterium RIFOXYD2_FULL_56_26]OGH01361.1 MAG: thymidylate synthase, flavin-dependent [Candidatus Lambdaproteobacteria bacterium RIFOXYC1_FULL_56_13]OGH06902.1 MAG: thymidylate synthase, flavin-dependent [Candidatus Lambdaproteobacteria bacterium RIFOXYD1_FULL_56_27]
MTKQKNPKLKVQFLGCTQDPVEVIYSAFRICYSKDDAALTWKKIRSGEISHETMETFVSEKLGTGHTSPLRQAQFIFVVDGVSRACTAQFNRHHIGIEREEMSQRYVNFHKGIGAFVTPPSFEEHQEVLERWDRLQTEILSFYDLCTQAGIKQEDARFALPMGTVSREQFAMGFQAMQQFLDVRMCERAQWEIRDMAWQIYKIMKKEFPSLAKRLGIKCWENRNLYCDEDYQAYQACKWSRSRPHKNDLSEIWKKAKREGP